MKWINPKWYFSKKYFSFIEFAQCGCGLNATLTNDEEDSSTSWTHTSLQVFSPSGWTQWNNISPAKHMLSSYIELFMICSSSCFLNIQFKSAAKAYLRRFVGFNWLQKMISKEYFKPDQVWWLNGRTVSFKPRGLVLFPY